MDQVRTAVIGAGHFGRYHADKYAALPRSRLVAIADSDAARAAATAAKHGVRAVADYRELFGQVDAVSVAVPTAAHHAVALDCLAHGLHVLVEKPLASTLEEADALIEAAARHGRVLQVGHIERFAVAAAGLDALVTRPLYIECDRIAPFKPRGTDVSVVQDLMIHDIDMVLAFVAAPIEAVDAVGAPVLTDSEDIANARLRFANGCVATLTASRISLKSERKVRIFQPQGYLSVDFLGRTVTAVRRGADHAFSADQRQFAEQDNLQAELAHFLECAASGAGPLVSRAHGRRAMEIAMLIEAGLRQHRARLQA